MKRGATLSIALAAVVASAGVGWFAGRQITSPAELAARAEPPTPSLITVAVEKRVLSADVIVRADIAYDDPVSISLSGAIGKPGEAAVVTQPPELDAVVDEGAVALEVAGRPVMVLQGVIPVYRDLRPGSEGLDVRQLEEALARLGHFGEAPDGVWTAATGSAIQAWYEAAGYRANAATDEEEAALDGARQRVRSSQDVVSSLERSIGEIQGASQSEILAARSDVATAKEQLELAQIQADGANSEAAAAVAEAIDEVTAAEQALASATDRLAQAEAGTHPDTGLPPTADELAELAGAVTDAEASLAVARDALSSAEQAERETNVLHASLVRQAGDAVAVAEARLSELERPPDTSSLRSQLSAARTELAAARADLEELQAEVGTWIPAGELVFLERMPVRVDRVAVSLGSIVAGPLMTVSGAEITVRANVDDDDADRVVVGAPAFIDDPDLEGPLEVVVESISERGTGGRVPVEMTVESMPDELIGRNVKLVIPIETTDGAVLAVPAAALSAVADGSVRVEVEDPDGSGTTRFVTVVPGLAADGLVEVTSVQGSLEEGDRVVVGFVTGDDA